ncbi:MAG: replication initiation protein [Butyrivibrio sp.]|nr:replication initiation protein [Butyrivibrio sp.]
MNMKEYKADLELIEQRDYKVVKANEIIQRARIDLGILELKTFAYVLSKVKPSDQKGQSYVFNIGEYCRVCGIDADNGKNYENVKKALKTLRDKSFWLIDEDGKETTVGWLSKAQVDKRSGKVTVKLDEDIQKYIIGWFEQYTQYSICQVLPMQSQYSFIMFEQLKSYANLKQHIYDIDDLKSKLCATHYTNFKDFRKNVLEIATREINQYTDLEVSWEPITQGRKVVQIKFYISERDKNWGNFRLKNKKQIDGQMDMYDFISGEEVKYTDQLITITKG